MKIKSNSVIPQTDNDVKFLNDYLNRKDIVIGESYLVDDQCLSTMIKLKIPIEEVPIGIYVG